MSSDRHMEIDLSNTGFEYAYKLISETPHSVFLSGKAGTGKSTFLRYIREHTRKKTAVVAPTGIAAVNVRGETIHGFFQLPLGPLLYDDKRIRNIRLRPEKRNLLRELELLIIDEVSMVRADTLDAIDTVLRVARKSALPFGGVQLLLVGDLFQLEPVARRDEWMLLEHRYPSKYFFGAVVFMEMELVQIELEKVYRQEDEDFIALLDSIRDGRAGIEELMRLNRRPAKPPEDAEQPTIILCGRRNKVDEINQSYLDRIAQPPKTYQGIINGEYPERQLPVESSLALKVGAQVMFVRNDMIARRWVNGTLGTVEELEEDAVYVQLENGRKHRVDVTEWEFMKYTFDRDKGRISEKILGTYQQLPLKHAWAVTIHKAQGLTFDRVCIDLGWGAFAAGQLYVALSRCRSLEGIFLRQRIRKRDLIVSEEVMEFRQHANDLKQIYRLLEND